MLSINYQMLCSPVWLAIKYCKDHLTNELKDKYLPLSFSPGEMKDLVEPALG